MTTFNNYNTKIGVQASIITPSNKNENEKEEIIQKNLRRGSFVFNNYRGSTIKEQHIETRSSTKKNNDIVLIFSEKLRLKCPNCNDSYEDGNLKRSPSVNHFYKGYVEDCKKRFGENSWPFCMSCWNMTELCHSCAIPLTEGPIFWSSSASYEIERRDHICSFCNHLTNDEVEKKMNEDLELGHKLDQENPSSAKKIKNK